MVKMRDVAKHAGVSVATVSNVITNKKYVGENVKKKVMDSIKTLNYNIDFIARALKTQQTGTIGVLVPDITKLAFLDMLKGILDTAQKEGYNINISSSNFNIKTEKNYVTILKNNRVDGIIIDSCVNYKNGSDWAKEMSDLGPYVPVVSMECKLDTNYISSIVFDTREITRCLIQHLVDIGKRNILFIAPPVTIEWGKAHYMGYKDVLKRNNIAILDDLILKGDFTSISGYNAALYALKKNLKFDAVWAPNDQAAIGVIKALYENGLSIPADVAVCGFDNVFASTLVKPAITTVSIPRYKMGVIAVQEVLRRIRDKHSTPKSYIMEAELIIRASTKPGIKTDWAIGDW